MTQKAILAGVNLYQHDFRSSMRELGNLAAACKIEAVGEVTQNLHHVNNAHYMGGGKIQEIAALVDEKKAKTVIFNDELSATQIRNLEEDLSCQVMDRTTLILDIFARRARTKEAQLQVEIARLQYMLPRLVGSRESLGRQGAGVGLANRGSGETKLELDRRKIKEKITALNKDLEALVAHRQTQRKQRRRKNVPVVSLVGYTNAGKSTIMNAILELSDQTSSEGKQVFEKDMLFATLETSVRNIKLPDNKSFILTDTVGFVRNLPHHLIKAFRSTLEEVTEADLLIHAVDYSNPEYQQHIDVTNATLKEIGVKNIPMIYAFNKADLTDSEWPRIEGDSVYLSAEHKTGIDELIQQFRPHIFQDYVQCEMLIPYDQGQFVSYFNESADVQATSYEEEGTKLTMECRKADFDKYHSYVIGS
ncbi:MAG TPA: GTPase HflX [Bacillales bacterium]|nr:GTPase HflX [Bacillales bacterium]